MLKKIFILSLLALFIVFSKSYAQNNFSDEFKSIFNPQKISKSAVFYDKEGNQVELSDFEGKVIVLNFWKATCRTCLIELPSLNRLAEKYPEIIVLAISQGDENADTIERVLHEERNLTNIPVSLDDNQKLFKLLGGDKVPQTRLIDKKGIVKKTIKGGADFDSEKIHKQIEELL